MLSSAQNAPTGEGFGQTFRDRQRFQFDGVHPARIGGIVARLEPAAGDRGPVIPDVEDVAVASGPAYGAEQVSRLDREASFFADLPHQGLGVGLAGLDPPARQ